MSIGQGSITAGARAAVVKVQQNPVQFLLAVLFLMCCGATKKLQTFPMPWIAGQSVCTREVSAVPDGYSRSFTAGSKSYAPLTWLETQPGCKEKAKVFTFVTESFTITTSYLVFFGVVKAIFNFITGVCCDRFGRKWTLVAGWALGIPMPLMVIFAKSWWSAAFSNVFLGMQQALVWSATIFIMIDYLGQANSGIAIGLNETIGYTTIAVVTQIAAAIMDENEPRTGCYYVAMALIGICLLVSIVCLRESKPVATDEAVRAAISASLVWPSGRTSSVSLGRSAFVYTSFVNKSLMSVCFAGLMVNFISGFAWGLFAKWMKNDYVVDGVLRWPRLSKEVVANVTLFYGIPKGVLQWFFGFLGDRFGRKWLIAAGLGLCVLGLAILAGTGRGSRDPVAGFAICALLVGIGTGVMYSNNLAAVCDHADPTWRSSALGAYRFWRDMGYAVGALVTGLFADSVGIFGSVLLTAALTLAATASLVVFYSEVQPGALGTDETSEDAAKAAGQNRHNLRDGTELAL